MVKNERQDINLLLVDLFCYVGLCLEDCWHNINIPTQYLEFGEFTEWIFLLNVCLCHPHLLNVCLCHPHLLNVCLCHSHLLNVCLCHSHLLNVCLCHPHLLNVCVSPTPAEYVSVSATPAECVSMSPTPALCCMEAAQVSLEEAVGIHRARIPDEHRLPGSRQHHLRLAGGGRGSLQGEYIIPRPWQYHL